MGHASGNWPSSASLLAPSGRIACQEIDEQPSDVLFPFFSTPSKLSSALAILFLLLQNTGFFFFSRMLPQTSFRPQPYPWLNANKVGLQVHNMHWVSGLDGLAAGAQHSTISPEISLFGQRRRRTWRRACPGAFCVCGGPHVREKRSWLVATLLEPKLVRRTLAGGSKSAGTTATTTAALGRRNEARKLAHQLTRALVLVAGGES